MPDQPEVSDTLAWIYYQKKMPQRALPLAQDSVARQPHNPVFLVHLASIQQGLGNTAEARALADRALKVRADFDGAAIARQLTGRP